MSDIDGIDNFRRLIDGITDQDWKLSQKKAIADSLAAIIQKFVEQISSYDEDTYLYRTYDGLVSSFDQESCAERTEKKLVVAFKTLNTSVDSKRQEIETVRKQIKEWQEQYSNAAESFNDSLKTRQSYHETHNPLCREVRQFEDEERFLEFEIKKCQHEISRIQNMLKIRKSIYERKVHGTIVKFVTAARTRQISSGIHKKVEIDEETPENLCKKIEPISNLTFFVVASSILPFSDERKTEISVDTDLNLSKYFAEFRCDGKKLDSSVRNEETDSKIQLPSLESLLGKFSSRILKNEEPAQQNETGDIVEPESQLNCDISLEEIAHVAHDPEFIPMKINIISNEIICPPVSSANPGENQTKSIQSDVAEHDDEPRLKKKRKCLDQDLIDSLKKKIYSDSKGPDSGKTSIDNLTNIPLNSNAHNQMQEFPENTTSSVGNEKSQNPEDIKKVSFSNCIQVEQYDSSDMSDDASNATMLHSQKSPFLFSFENEPDSVFDRSNNSFTFGNSPLNFLPLSPPNDNNAGLMFQSTSHNDSPFGLSFAGLSNSANPFNVFHD